MSILFQSFNKKEKAVFVFLGLVAVGFIGYIDDITGTYLNLTIFYILPIMLYSWYISQTAGFILTLIAAIEQTFINYNPPTEITVNLWNALVQTNVYIIIVLVLGTLRKTLENKNHLVINLESALAREKELNELKSRFVSMVSHEFRTPLSLIRTANGMLRSYEGKMDQEDKTEHFNTIETEVTNLNNMLNDVLVLGKSEYVSLYPETFNLKTFCIELVKKIKEANGFSHKVIFDYYGEEQVFLDKKLMNHLISNLLSNALKYSVHQTAVRLNIMVENQKVTLTVEDEGIGIPQEEQENLFEPFFRARNVNTIPGTGIGLSIVKSLVKAYGGEISVKSSLSRGTRFIIEIPLNIMEKFK